jgi:hypothetical protein
VPLGHETLAFGSRTSDEAASPPASVTRIVAVFVELSKKALCDRKLGGG